MIKYLWSAAGYALIAVPFLFTRNKRRQIDSPPEPETREARDNAVAGRTESTYDLFLLGLSILTCRLPFSIHFQ